jgi:hypothetical protein
MSELTEALIAIAKGGCECETTDERCDGTCIPSIAEWAAKRIAELVALEAEVKVMQHGAGVAYVKWGDEKDRVKELEAKLAKAEEIVKAAEALEISLRGSHNNAVDVGWQLLEVVMENVRVVCEAVRRKRGA